MKQYLDKIKIIKILIFSFLFFLFVGIHGVSALCIWKNAGGGGSFGVSCSLLGNSDGYIYKGGDFDCGEIPDGMSNRLCCCNEKPASAAPATDPDQPKLVIPDLQISIPGVVYNSADITCTGDAKNRTCQSNFIGKYIVGIYKYALGVIGIIAVIVMMIGGVMWIVAGGNASRVTEAKAWIGASITGLVLMLSSYTILSMINPDLVSFKAFNIALTEVDKFVENRIGATSQTYGSKSCPTQQELINGTDFYATGYVKPPYGSDLKSLCMIAMNCSCPNGRDTSKNCDAYFSNYKNYRPCLPFPQTTPYCNLNSSGLQPKIGDIAADLNCLPRNSQVCATDKSGKKTTYTVKDTGGGIKGRRIDIWSGSDLSTANKSTGNVTLKSGACQ